MNMSSTTTPVISEAVATVAHNALWNVVVNDDLKRFEISRNQFGAKFFLTFKMLEDKELAAKYLEGLLNLSVEQK